MKAIDTLISRYPDLDPVRESIEAAAKALIETYENGNKVMVCGNGGSASDSEHIVGELMKGYFLKREVSDSVRENLKSHFPDDGDYLADHLQGALPAISLVSQSALVSAYANDVAAEMVYAQQVYGYGKAGDALIALSTSGNSRNVINAVKVANALGVRTIGMTSAKGGQLAELCDITISAPRESTPDVQELHLPIYHAICELLEGHFFG
ncbi:MAG: SIS domain-containing protein [Deltaproteobacteria bacterium]|nr:SIS domain-containing protein [Deltaproteobacteria bacterium]